MPDGANLPSQRKGLDTRRAADPGVRGICGHCDISLYGAPARPAAGCMPCNLDGCPFEDRDEQLRALSEDDLERLRLIGEQPEYSGRRVSPRAGAA